MTRAQLIGLWSVCAIGFAFSANYTNHAPMATVLAAKFGFSLAAAGLLTTGIFLTHAVMQIPGGYLADRLGPKPVLAVALAIVFLGNLAIAFSTGYAQLLFWKVFAGLGTGASFVAGARYVATVFAGPRLHFAQGLYGGSILLGSGFVIFAVPLLLASFGWQGAFFSTAAVAGAAWLIWIFLTPDPPLLAHKPAPLAGMLSNPQLWLLGITQMASFGLVIVVGVWVTTYLSRSFDLPLASAGRIGSLVLLMGIATRPLGGAIVPRWGAKRTLQVSLALSAAACLNFGLGGRSLAQASVGVLLLGLGCGLPYAAVFNRAAALYPARAGAAMGLVNMLGISMILAAPPLIGQMVEWSGNFRSSFLALGAFALLAWVATLGIHQHESDRSV
jgi:MFS transporter, NNP family, nitrate/nitrite transporter